MPEQVSQLIALWRKLYEEGEDVAISKILATHRELKEYFECRPDQLAIAREQIDKRRAYARFNNESSADASLENVEQKHPWIPGQQPIPGYALVELIDRGGSGEVWKAKSPGNIGVALKRVIGHGKLGRKERETLETVRDLKPHKCILQIHAYWERPGELIIASTLAEDNLKNKLKCNPGGITFDQLFEYIRQAAEGLDYLGGVLGIQHRDVKPANLLLVADSVVIGDLGLIKPVAGSRASNSGWGTLGYMAPEAQAGQLSRHSDQYSLAMTYIELRTGKLSTPVDSPRLSDSERRALKKALNRDPNQRFASCLAFIDAVKPGATESLASGTKLFVCLGRPTPLNHFVDRPKQREWLDRAIANNTAPIVVVKAIGGQGKTTLIADWLNRIEQSERFPFDAVCYFSAYRFGVDYIGFLTFVAESLDESPVHDNATLAQLTRKVLHLLGRRRTLILLDGIERWLQGGVANGGKKDAYRGRVELDSAKGFGALLGEVASLRNGSKIVLTTRVLPAALDGTIGRSAEMLEGDAGLPGLSEREGLVLLNKLGVVGSEKDKRACVKELNGHPLSLTILAGSLRNLGKSITQRRVAYELTLTRNDKLNSIMTQAEKLCGEDNRLLLQAAALCPENSPVEAISAATGETVARDELLIRLQALQEWGLLALGGQYADMLQMHPIVRNHFENTVPDANAMHSRLATYFAAIPISANARSLHRVSTRIWSVQHAFAAQEFERGLHLLLDEPLVTMDKAETVTLSQWFQEFGQSTFELEWSRRLMQNAPATVCKILLNGMAVAAGSLGETQLRRELLDEAKRLAERI